MKEARRDGAERKRAVPVSKTQTAVTRESTSWKNMISFLFAGNYVSRCVNTVRRQVLLRVTACMSLHESDKVIVKSETKK